MDTQPDLIAKIDELIAATREASVPAPMRWAGTEAVAAMFGFKSSYFLEHIAALPDFPRPLRVQGRGNPKWNVAEVDAWARKHRDAHAPH